MFPCLLVGINRTELQELQELLNYKTDSAYVSHGQR